MKDGCGLRLQNFLSSVETLAGGTEEEDKLKKAGTTAASGSKSKKMGSLHDWKLAEEKVDKMEAALDYVDSENATSTKSTTKQEVDDDVWL